MALHIDIIKSDPLATEEHRLARAVLEGGEVEIDATDNPDYWRSTLATATGISPDDEPQRFFEALPARLEGTYVYATDPHVDDECPLEHPDVASEAATA
jgi:hypothetical protein